MRVVDEAKAVERPIFDATEGMLDAPETFDLWISTPSIQDGEFYKLDSGSSTEVMRHAVDVDELIADGVPGKLEWKEDCLEKWGEDSPDYQARVKAQYIDNAQGTMFPLSWVERAMAQEWEIEQPLVAGMDVAGSIDGDQNAVAVAAGPDAEDRFHVRTIEAWNERDTMVSKGRALSIAQPIGATLRVDVIGLGKGVADAAGHEYAPVQEYRASSPATDPVRFLNRKAEDGWLLRNRLEKTKIRLPNVQTLKTQLAAMRYEITAAGKIRVVDPPDSPDWADAVIIATGHSSTAYLDWLDLKIGQNAAAEAQPNGQ